MIGDPSGTLMGTAWSPGSRSPVFAQLGGCNLQQIMELIPGVSGGVAVFRSATPSIAAPPLHIHAFKFSACPLKSKFMLGDFNKNFAYRLLNEPWDVLIVDFMRDMMTGFIKTGGTYVTELNQYIEGEPVSYEDTFLQEYEVFDWKHPQFFDQWSEGAIKLVSTMLSPMIDKGRRVVMVELLPSMADFDEGGQIEPGRRDPDADARIAMMRQMYAFAATLDPRIVRIEIEDEYHIGVFDARHGAHFGHQIADYYARAAEKILCQLGMWNEDVQTALSAHRLNQHVLEYRSRAANFLAAKQTSSEIEAERNALVAGLVTAEADRIATAAAAADAAQAWVATQRDAEARLAAMSEAREAMSREIEFARGQSAELTAALLEAEAAAVDLKGRNAAVEADFALRRQAFADEARGLTGRLAALRDDHLRAEAASQAALAAQQAEAVELERRLGVTIEAVNDLRRAALALEADREALKQRVDALLHSSSWRFTAPLRGVKSGWLRLRRPASWLP